MRIPRNRLKSRITVERFAGAGSRGAFYDPPQEGVRANVQPSRRLVVSADARTIVAVLEALTRPEEDIPVESRITYEGQKYRVISSVPMPDEVRPQHRELQLARLG